MGTQLRDAPSKKGGTVPQFSAHVCCRQTVSRCHLVPYGGRPQPRPHSVRLGPSSPSPHEGGTSMTAHNFRPMSVDSNWLYGSRCHLGLGVMPPPRRHCVRWGPSSPLKGHNIRTIFGPCLVWPNGRPSQLLLSTCYL